MHLTLWRKNLKKGKMGILMLLVSYQRFVIHMCNIHIYFVDAKKIFDSLGFGFCGFLILGLIWEFDLHYGETLKFNI